MYHFIINPNARSGRGAIVWYDVQKSLAKRNIPYTAHFTQYRRHATAIAHTITCDRESHTLIVLGGDGTIDEVINGIVCFEKTLLGYIPIGSGNDFARGLNLSSDPEVALDRILGQFSTKTIDLGLLEYADKKHIFAVSSGIGYDASICHAVCVSRFKILLNKLKLGKLAYVFLSFDRLFHCKPQRMELILDDNIHLNFKKFYFATAMNLPFEGGGCKFCPNARPDDGMLDIIVVADVSKPCALSILPFVFNGLHTHHKGVYIYRCKKAVLHSSGPMPVHSDGEPIFLQHDLAFTICPKQLKIIQT